MITNAVITIHNEQGESIGFELSYMQLITVCKILGIKYNDGEEISCFSDETLKKLIEMDRNPFKLKRTDE